MKLMKDYLKKNFKYYGKLKKVTIVKDKNGKSRGYGFIEFFNAADCKEAYNKMHNVRILKNNIYIDYQKSNDLNFLPMKLGGHCGRNRRYKKEIEIKLNEIYQEYPNLKPDNLFEYKRLVIKRLEKRNNDNDKINKNHHLNTSNLDLDLNENINNNKNSSSIIHNEMSLKEEDKNNFILKSEGRIELDLHKTECQAENKNKYENEYKHRHVHEQKNEYEHEDDHYHEQEQDIDYLNKKRNSKHFKENDCEKFYEKTNTNVNTNQHVLISNINYNSKSKQPLAEIKDEVLKNKFECDKRSDNSSN